MKDLPGQLADVQHLMSVLPYVAALAMMLLLGLIGLWMKWRAWRRRRAPPARTSPAPAPAKAAVRVSGAGDRIRGIRERYERSREYRQGCHELSSALREHFDTKKSPLAALTAGEIVLRLGETSLARLFQTLAELQFSRDEPTSRAFREVCEQAAKEVSTAAER